MQWYYHKDGKRLGPISEQEFNAAISDGSITGDTLVWNEDMAEWQPYSEVRAEPGDAAASAPAAPPAATGDQVTCRECHAPGLPDSMAPYGEQWICSDCKETFFQRIKEGVNVNTGRSLGTGGMTSNSELIIRAKEQLADNWGGAIGASAIFSVIMMSVSGLPYIGPLVSLFIIPPLGVGHNRYYLKFIADEQPDASVVFSGFNQFGPAFLAALLRSIFIGLMAVVAYAPLLAVIITMAVQNQNRSGGASPLFITLLILSIIWFLGAIVVITMFTLKWILIEWIIADNPDVQALDAFRMSGELMNGNKMKAFFLGLHFIGWSVLAVLTCCIGYLFLVPYYKTAFAYFYEDIKDPS